jgi:hypothetical protein
MLAEPVWYERQHPTVQSRLALVPPGRWNSPHSHDHRVALLQIWASMYIVLN